MRGILATKFGGGPRWRAASPVAVNLQVDGTTLATAVHRADRDAATRGTSPVPTYRAST
jgi:hypothetical protein